MRDSSQAARRLERAAGDGEAEDQRAREGDELVQRGEAEGVVRGDRGAERGEARRRLRLVHHAR